MKDINQGIAIWRKTWDGINLLCMVGLLLIAVYCFKLVVAVLELWEVRSQASYIKRLPALIHLPLVILTKFLFTTVWWLIPGDLKPVRGVSGVMGGVSQVDDSAVSEPLVNQIII